MSACAICDGVGLVRVVNAQGQWVSRACECQEMEREQRRLAAARIPERYRHCSLDTYETAFRGANASLAKAHLIARKFVEAYPASIPPAMAFFLWERPAWARPTWPSAYCKDLSRSAASGASFATIANCSKTSRTATTPQVQTTELELLKPVFAAEVLVLDDLGAQRPNEWVWDTVALILNSRYNDKQTTIITTN